MRNFRKCVKTLLNACFSNQHSEEFLCRFLLKSGITKNCLWWRVVVSCISHANGKVLPRVVKFYREIFYECHFSNTSRRLLMKLPRNNQSFLIQSQFAEHQRISYRFFSNFSCVLLLSSVLLTFSVLFSPDFCRDQVRMLFDICWKGNSNRIEPRKRYFC